MKTEPTEALRAMANDLKYNVGVIHSNPQLILEESFISGVRYGQSSPKIKQLEWDFYRVYYSARTSIGEYAIKEDVNYYGISNNNGCILTYNGVPLGKSHLVFDNAKAAAQADFEKRVMDCLDL